MVQPRKTGPFITEILLMGCKESKQTNKRAGSNTLYFFDTYMELNILSKDVNAKPMANMDFIFT